MKPLKDLIVIEMQDQAKEKKVGNLWVQPPKWAKPTNVGKVLQKGPEVSSVAVGDSVLINPYAVLDTEEKLVKLVREKDVLCLIEAPKQ
jgi:co-chaperonin GroES (HSP10)